VKSLEMCQYEMQLFAGILQTLEISSKVSSRLCTAEGRGSNSLGSSRKMTICRDIYRARRDYGCTSAPLCSNAEGSAFRKYCSGV
jgi:hypothetical protein